MKVTVAICTWNRADLLDRTLAEMCQLRLPGGTDWELLVVNNNCTDDTDRVIARHAAHLPVRRLSEPKPGQCHARNCAVAAAAGELIVWTDDDVLVDPDWLAEHMAAAAAWPRAAFFGGTVDPWFAVEPPRWIRRNLDRLGGYYVTRQLGPAVRPLADGELPFGANMAFRTNVLRQFAFDPRIGHVGGELVGGDEVELVGRLRKAGHQGVWVGTARVRHYIPAERLTRQYVWDRRRGEARLCARQENLAGLDNCRFLFGSPRWLLPHYWRACLKSWCLSAFKGRRWLRAFLQAAFFRGLIDEARARREASRSTGSGQTSETLPCS
jgi:glycosyltransferase involved in cell wall biosynthesis